MKKPQFQQVSAHTPALESRALEAFLEPIRDVVRRRFFSRTDERVVSRQDLIDLGLIKRDDLNKLES